MIGRKRKTKLQPREVDMINQWCFNAQQLSYTKKDIKKRIKSYPKEVKKRILKTFKDLEYVEKSNKWLNDMKGERMIKRSYKGGYNQMVTKKPKWNEEEYEEDIEPEDEQEEEMEDLDSEEGEVKHVGGRKKKGQSYDEIHAREIQQKRKKTPAVYQRPAPVVTGGKDWLVRQIPPSFECIDPVNGEVVLTAGSYEELMLSLQVMSTQHAVESAKNTR